MQQFNLKQLERGQGTLEYSLMIAFVAIVALTTITILANPQNFREGILYQGIYRPVQCAVQGISRDNCANTGNFNAIRYPGIANGTSRKLCSNGDYVTAGEAQQAADDTGDPWSACTSVGSGGPTGSEPPTIDQITYNRIDATGVGILSANTTIGLEGTYDFVATGSTSIESIAFSIVQNTPAAAGILDDSDDAADFTATNPDYTGVALTAGTYTITATPYTGDGLTGTAGAAVSIPFIVEARPSIPPTVTGFTLVNLDLPVGDQNRRIAIQANQAYPQATYAIEVSTNGDDDYALVSLSNSGVNNVRRDDDPYSVFGNTGADLTGQLLTPNTYTVSAQVFDVNDVSGDTNPVSLNFTIEPPDDTLSVSRVDLINANSDVVMQAISDGDTVVLSETEDLVDFRAVGADENAIGSMTIRLDGPVSVSRTENEAPYAAFGDNNGNYFGSFLTPGSYTITMTPWELGNAGGEQGTQLVVNFTVEAPPEVTGPQVTEFWLYNNSTNSRERRLSSGDILDASDINFNWRIQTVTEPERVSYVLYDMTGDVTDDHRENAFTYDFPGSGTGNSLNYGPGSYSLAVTAYLNGEEGPTATLDFTVVP